MTDLERFVALYASVGIVLTPTQATHRYSDAVFECTRHELLLDVSGYEGEKTPKVHGYAGFFTRICFDEHGAFVAQGIWE